MDATAAFHRANKLREKGDLAALQKLFASGNDDVKAGVLNALEGEPGDNPEMGPGIIAMAVEGATHSAAEVRRWACYVFQSQNGWGVDVSSAIEPLLTLLRDPDAEVRRMASFATGNVYKRRFDCTRHFTALRQLLSDEALYVPEAAAWALTKLSRAKFDIGPAVPELVALLTLDLDYNEPWKIAARALLHHSKKSAASLALVRKCVREVVLDTSKKEIKGFLDKLSQL